MKLWNYSFGNFFPIPLCNTCYTPFLGSRILYLNSEIEFDQAWTLKIQDGGLQKVKKAVSMLYTCRNSSNSVVWFYWIYMKQSHKDTLKKLLEIQNGRHESMIISKTMLLWWWICNAWNALILTSALYNFVYQEIPF